MSAAEINLLCTADLHLGRYPSRIPSEHSSSSFSPISIWKDIVRKAINLEVDAVVIAGDIIDRESCYYQAYGPFEQGINSLAAEQIVTFAVAGNHDYDLLPELAASIDSKFFIFLGAEGKWESRQLKRKGEAVLNLCGWSYPQQHVTSSPLVDFELPDNGLATVALLHAERNNPSSNYAPVASAELKGVGTTAWVLGHVHQPALDEHSAGIILNPGSPQPLNPNERKCHSIWTVTIKDPGDFEASRLPIANLKYASLEIDAAQLAEVKQLPGLIFSNLEAQLRREYSFDWSPELILLEVILSGCSDLHLEIDQQRESLIQQLEGRVAGSRILIEQLKNQTHPPVELTDLAGANSSVSLLADYLLKLERGEQAELPKELVQRIYNKLNEAYNSNAYTPLKKKNRIKPPSKEDVFKLISQQGRRLLAVLLAQKEAGA
ncbi:metallophosphoesterase family protein [Fuchsiella alkaliacetigena]|uniref:metallophosphoesterase family protein n=1 Tax=Fuchsiella alkaliacetigena TaxID=957042 RepID=UPI00200B4495|nr:DNA repair exonuclease [Fuchsiella alkaliacetigena]MCK8823573.1 DNA repair exonuclease [Fuchsiella alkaliacetigena]